jgi:hypothetical protein
VACPHGLLPSAGYFVLAQGAEDVIAKSPDGTSPWGWTIVGDYCLRSGDGPLVGLAPAAGEPAPLPARKRRRARAAAIVSVIMKACSGYARQSYRTAP